MALDTTIGGEATDSYGTVADFHSHVHDFHGADISGNAVDTDEAFLRRALLILDWSWAWLGTRVSSTQKAAFPRHVPELVDGTQVKSDEIPGNIRKAQLEIAYILSQGIDLAPTIQGGAVSEESVSAGPVSTTTKYAAIHEVPRATMVNMLVRPFHDGLTGGFGSGKVIRG